MKTLLFFVAGQKDETIKLMFTTIQYRIETACIFYVSQLLYLRDIFLAFYFMWF